MGRLTGIHWQAPTTVILALLAGVLFAIGHHLFYNSLNNQPVQNRGYTLLGSVVSLQQINIAGGTAFSFLVKACLATAIGAAYAQLFWRAMQHRTPELNLQRLDSTFSALTNIHHLFKFWHWWRYPLLFGVVLTAWLIPVALIVTPATLSIKSAAVIPPHSAMMNVPNIDFVNLNYLNWMTSGHISYSYARPNKPVQYFYNGPSRAVTNIVQAVAAGGAILPLRNPGLNSSYTLEFPGPSLRCANIPADLRAVMQANIARATQPVSNDCTPYGFLGWTPAQNLNYSGLLPQPLPFTVTSDGNYSLNAYTLTNRAGSSPASLFIAAIPGMVHMATLATHQIASACVDLTENSTLTRNRPFVNSTFLQCDLLNSTYTADFKFVNGEQDVSIRTTPIDGNIITTAYAIYGSSLYPKAGANASDSSCSPFNLNDQTCAFNSSLVSTLAYQTVFESFNALLVGSVIGGESPTFETRVQDTSLIDSPELAFLSEPVTPDGFGLVSLQQAVLASNGTSYNGIYDNKSTVTNKPLAAAMEELFQNITISLMTSKQLQPNPSSAFAPSLTNVTLHNYHNVYTYSAWKLWTAYGLAILFASICAIAGLITIVVNHASYSLGFSTVLRASKCAYTNVQLTEEDFDNRDPLPPHLVKAKIWLGTPSKVPEEQKEPTYVRITPASNGDSGEANRDHPTETSSMLLSPHGTEPQERTSRTSS